MPEGTGRPAKGRDSPACAPPLEPSGTWHGNRLLCAGSHGWLIVTGWAVTLLTRWAGIRITLVRFPGAFPVQVVLADVQFQKRTAPEAQPAERAVGGECVRHDVLLTPYATWVWCTLAAFGVVPVWRRLAEVW